MIGTPPNQHNLGGACGGLLDRVQQFPFRKHALLCFRVLGEVDVPLAEQNLLSSELKQHGFISASRAPDRKVTTDESEPAGLTTTRTAILDNLDI